jgi:hypothetical protein
LRRFLWAIFFVLACSCRAGGCAANVLGDVVDATGDAHCDRRFVSGADKKPASFCQEIIDTIALSEFQDDCRSKHTAISGEGLCARDKIIGGCKLHKENDDGSEVYDWFYDVTELEADGGVFEEPVRTKEEIEKLCVDPKRYEEGAHFVMP